MRMTVEENRKLGEEIVRKAVAATGPTCIMIPFNGIWLETRVNASCIQQMAHGVAEWHETEVHFCRAENACVRFVALPSANVNVSFDIESSSSSST